MSLFDSAIKFYFRLRLCYRFSILRLCYRISILRLHLRYRIRINIQFLKLSPSIAYHISYYVETCQIM